MSASKPIKKGAGHTSLSKTIDDPDLKKAVLYSLSSILKRWKKKDFILNLFNNSLLIRTKGKEKLLYLDSYCIKNIGKFKKKWCFSLESVSLNERRYIIGSPDQELYEKWLSWLQNLNKNQKFDEKANNKFDHFDESMEDFLLGNSMRDGIGNSLSPYENFLSRDEIMSPCKQANPEKQIYDSIPQILLDQYTNLSNIMSKNNYFKYFSGINDPEWTLSYKEEFIEKNFKVFLNNKHKNKGRVVMTLNDKSMKDVFKDLKDPEYAVLWNNNLFSLEFKQENNNKTLRVNQIHKPNDLYDYYQELDFIRYHGKDKNFCFFLNKSSNQSKEDFKEVDFLFPHTKYQYEKIKNKVKKGKVIQQTVCISDENIDGQAFCLFLLETEMYFSEEIDENLNNQLLFHYLISYQGLHKLLIPLCQLKENVFDKFSNDLSDKMQKSVKKKNENIILSPKVLNSNKRKFAFVRGNCENYGTKESLTVFYDYFKSQEYVIDSIKNYYNLGPIENKGIKLETNEQSGHFAFKKDYSRAKNGGLNFMNAELMEEQKKVIISLLKQAGSNIIHGRSFMNVSLPLEVFEPRSFLERLARSFGHAPVFLEKAATINNALEQLKLTITFFISSIIMCIQQEKPFNPILGETFQGRINGYPIYLEQITHHPPITYYLLNGKNYKLYGSHEPVANLTPNTLVAEQKGNPIVWYKNTNNKVHFRWPMFIINGTAMGRRYLNFISKAISYDKENNLLAEINFNVSEVGGFSGLFQKKESYCIDEIGGAIYKVKPDVINRYEKAKKPYKLNLDLNNDISETICKIKGEWTNYIEFDGKRYWDIEKDRPYICEYEENPLPSDCNFRSDVILMRMGNRPEAQVKKNEGENSQRYDKKLRENYKSKKNKKNKNLNK